MNKIFKMYACSTLIPSNNKKILIIEEILNSTLLKAIETRHSSFPYHPSIVSPKAELTHLLSYTFL